MKLEFAERYYRYMGLNDLLLEIKQDQTNFLGDETMENRVLKQVLALVEDKISEVKNQAVKWCADYRHRMHVEPAHIARTVWGSSSRSSASHKW